MSSILSDLVGCRCIIKTEDEEYLTGSPDILCRITCTDGEWLRVSYVDEIGNRISRISRVEYLSDVTVFEE